MSVLRDFDAGTVILWLLVLTAAWLVLKWLGRRMLILSGRWDPFARLRRRSWWLKVGLAMSARGRAAQFGQQSTGGWASFWEIVYWRFQKGDIFLGRAPGTILPIGIPTEKHMVTIAHAGAYKTTGALIPNLLLHEGSALCIDPVGELARITAARRGQGGNGVRGMGQAVHVVDPYGLTGMPSALYNVFDEMDHIARGNPDGPVSYAAKVAETLVEVTPGTNAYWDRASRTFLLGLILYVYIGPAQKRNLITVRRLLMDGDAEALERFIASGEATRKNTPFQALLIAMKNCPPGPYRDAIAGGASSFLEMGDNQRGGVLTQAQEHTSFLDIPEIARVSKGSSFRLADLKDKRMTVYICVPINMVSGVVGRWLRMFVMLLTDMMTRVAVAPNPPILLVIDEFPHLGRLEGMDKVAPLMRKYGVRLWVVGQGIEQFKAVYPESWLDFIGNAEAVQFMGIKDQSTVKMIVEFLGEHAVRDRQTGMENERNLLDPNQVSQLLQKGEQNQIIWRGDRRPMVLKVTPYFEYLPYWYYSPDPRYPEAANRAMWRRGPAASPVPLPPPPTEALPPARPSLPGLAVEAADQDRGQAPGLVTSPRAGDPADEPADNGNDLPSYDRPETWRSKSVRGTLGKTPPKAPALVLPATEPVPPENPVDLKDIDFGSPTGRLSTKPASEFVAAKSVRDDRLASRAPEYAFVIRPPTPEFMMEKFLDMAEAGGFTLTDAAMEKAARLFLLLPEKDRSALVLHLLMGRAADALKSRVGPPGAGEAIGANPIDAQDIPEKIF